MHLGRKVSPGTLVHAFQESLWWGQNINDCELTRGFPGGSVLRICLLMQETQVQSLGQEDPLEKKTATHTSVLAWEIPWTEEAGRLPLMGSQRVRRDSATETTPPQQANETSFPWLGKKNHVFLLRGKSTKNLWMTQAEVQIPATLLTVCTLLGS